MCFNIIAKYIDTQRENIQPNMEVHSCDPRETEVRGSDVQGQLAYETLPKKKKKAGGERRTEYTE